MDAEDVLVAEVRARFEEVVEPRVIVEEVVRDAADDPASRATPGDEQDVGPHATWAGGAAPLDDEPRCDADQDPQHQHRDHVVLPAELIAEAAGYEIASDLDHREQEPCDGRCCEPEDGRDRDRRDGVQEARDVS